METLMEGKISEVKEVKTVRFQILITPREAEMVAELRWKYRIRSRSETMRFLMEKGLEALKNEAKAA